MKSAPQIRRWELWGTGFRSFFLGAALWSVVSMSLWFGVLHLGWKFPFNGQGSMIWHAHEMIYGYSIAVVSGFLLTAVPNWTETKPVCGLPLGFVFITWLGARIFSVFGGGDLIVLTAGLDLLFIVCLLSCTASPIIKTKNWKQSGVLAKVILLGAGNLAFYLGATGYLENGIRIGLYSGFYLIIALVLVLGRRLIPFFIERRLDLSESIRVDKWLDNVLILLFFMFWVFHVFTQHLVWTQLTALLLFFLHIFRLYHWYRPGIWKDPLLWVLFVAYGFLVLSFIVIALPLFGVDSSPFLPLHLFAVGGIGLITCGMMSRISLGHTGRNIKTPPDMIGFSFACIILAAITRVFLPMFFTNQYGLWLVISQLLWIAGFSVFILSYLSILLSPRIDGKLG